MSEEKRSTPSTVLHRALDYAWKIATVVMCIWVVVGLPTMSELDRHDQLSRLEITALWVLPTLVAWGVAWCSRRGWVARVRTPPASVRARGEDLALEVGDPGPGAELDFEHDRALEVRELSLCASRVLLRLLRAYSPAGPQSFVFRPHTGRSASTGPPSSVPQKDLLNACQELKARGFVSRVEHLGGNAGVRVWLARSVREGNVLVVRGLVVNHLEDYFGIITRDSPWVGQ